MGGFGSGRQGWRRKCEHLLRLDIRVLSRRGYISSEPHILRFFSWHWTRGDEPAGSEPGRQEQPKYGVVGYLIAGEHSDAESGERHGDQRP